MTDFKGILNLGSGFEVTKKLSVADYLEKANLTDIERDYLQVNLNSLQILYDVRCHDGSEFMIIEAETSLPRLKYSAVNTAHDIAVSFPYSSMIILRFGNNAQVFVYRSDPNKRNLGRMAIKRSSHSEIFPCSSGNSIKPNIGRFFINVRNAVKKADSAEMLSGLVFNSLRECNLEDKARTKYNNFDDADISEVLECMEKSSLDTEDYGECVEATNRSIPWDSDINGAALMFEECCNYCYTLYCDYSSKREIPLRLWLPAYVDACCEMLKDGFKAIPSQKGLRKLKTVFDGHEIMPDIWENSAEISQSLDEFFKS